MTPRAWRLPLLLSGLVLLSQAFPIPSPVRDAATLSWVYGYHLSFPFWHLVFTPFCGIADLLTVLSLRQADVLITYVVIGCLLAGKKRGPVFFLLVLVFIAWGALVARPMGRLVGNNPNVLLIDFHSHSQYSHDGRRSFTPQANMRWHHDQGYDAAFITDHNRVEAAQIAQELSRREDWQQTGYRSLEGEEVSLKKTHVVILGNHERVDNRPYDSDGRKISSFIADMHAKGIPVIASLPEYWLYHWDKPIASQWGKDNGTVQDFVAWGMDGFEIVNSAPKALDFPKEDRLQIVDLCRRQNLYMTGISDNHGYGYATAVWNAMRIPGWQSMGPDVLEKTILSSLKNGGFGAVQVLERVKFFPDTTLDLWLTPFGSLWIYWRSLQPLQVLSWIIWIWGFCLLRQKSFVST
jgi:hypothetical protein